MSTTKEWRLAVRREVVGIRAEPCNDGVTFLGPRGKAAWAPNGAASPALAFVAGSEKALHPWDQWANMPRQDESPRPRRAAKAGTQAQAAREA
jgi:hypothetical protein